MSFLFDKKDIMPHITRNDRLRLYVHLANNTKMWKWLATKPPEEDVWKAYALECSEVNPRARLLVALVFHGLSRMKHRLLTRYGAPTRASTRTTRKGT